MGQTWMSYSPPMGEAFIDISLVIASERFDSNDKVVNELEKHGKLGYLVDTWRKRDLATYIWLNLTLLCLFLSIIGFWRIRKRVKDVGNPLTGFFSTIRITHSALNDIFFAQIEEL
jgi:hypothetical protein